MNTEENWGKKEKKWIFLVLDKSSNGENEQEQLSIFFLGLFRNVV